MFRHTGWMRVYEIVSGLLCLPLWFYGGYLLLGTPAGLRFCVWVTGIGALIGIIGAAVAALSDGGGV
jgi:hypothetical protein